MDRLRAWIGGARVAMLTTIEPGGGVRSRPMATQEITDDGEAWFFTNDTSPKVGEVRRECHVNLVYERPVRGIFVSVSGVAEVVRDKDRMRELWHPMMHAWFPEGLDDPSLCLMRVSIDKAECWDAPAGGLVQVARYAGNLLGRPARPPHQFGRQVITLRHPPTPQPAAAPRPGRLPGTAGGTMGEAPKEPESTTRATREARKPAEEPPKAAEGKEEGHAKRRAR